MILVDTSVWIDHLRRGVERLAELLADGRVMVHGFVIGEIACGNLAFRREVLSLLGALPHAPTVGDDEALFLIERRGPMGQGIGWVDVYLLASSLVCGAPLWSRDRRLAAQAERLKVAYVV